MATHRISSPFTFEHRSVNQPRFIASYNAFVDGQEANALAWWLASLLIHGCLLVPLTFLYVYSSDGPTIAFLAVSMACFFINIIANMGSAAFNFTFNSLVFSIIVHIVILVATLLLTF